MKNFTIKSLSAIALIGINITVFGQKIDAKSKTILDNITKSYKSKRILTSNFLIPQEAQTTAKARLGFSTQTTTVTS